MAQKNIYKIFLPQNILIFLEPKKILKFKILNPKDDPSLRMYENIRVHPPPPPLGDIPKMKNLPSSQIWNSKHLFLFGTSHKRAG